MTDATLHEVETQVEALGDPTRRRIYRFILHADGPVGVAELTDEFKLNHNAIRKHLIKLRDVGLVTEQIEERRTRGRPRLEYRPLINVLAAWGTGGAYELLAQLLISVLHQGVPPYEVGRRHAAETFGDPAQSEDRVAELLRALTAEGFSPCLRTDLPSTIVLERCPLERAASADQSLVCELHRGIVDGILAGAGEEAATDFHPGDPHEAGCVIRFGS